MAPGAQNQQQPTKNFSGNGVSVAAMCAESHQYRPVAANEGGVVDRRLTPILTQVWVLHWVLPDNPPE